MLIINSVAGNIFDEKHQLDNVEFLHIFRADMEKNRMRRKTDKGTDVGLDLQTHAPLRNGDILKTQDKTIVVKQLPEKVITSKIKNDKNSIKLLVLLGHIIGNRHRPISIKDNTVSFPIQSDSELDVFKKLLSNILDGIELSIEEQIFVPQTGANVHDHR